MLTMLLLCCIFFSYIHRVCLFSWLFCSFLLFLFCCFYGCFYFLFFLPICRLFGKLFVHLACSSGFLDFDLYLIQFNIFVSLAHFLRLKFEQQKNAQYHYCYIWHSATSVSKTIIHIFREKNKKNSLQLRLETDWKLFIAYFPLQFNRIPWIVKNILLQKWNKNKFFCENWEKKAESERLNYKTCYYLIDIDTRSRWDFYKISNKWIN